MTTSLETFQIALDEIKKLTEEKQELLSIIKKQEKAIKLLNDKASADIPKVEANSSTGLYKLESMMKESNAAMKKYTEKLRKEGEKHAKQKQS